MEDYLLDIKPFLNNDGLLIAFPAKHKKKLIALWYLSTKVKKDAVYSESEINALLNEWTTFHDPATLRRELYNKNLINRTPDCRKYWKEKIFLR